MKWTVGTTLHSRRAAKVFTVSLCAPGPENGAKDNRLHPLSYQSSLGIEQRILPELSVEANLFYNRLTNLIVGREDAFRFYSGPPPVGPFDIDPYANEGTGRVCGIELLAKLQTSRAVALISATFGNSARVDRVGDDEERLP